MEMFENPNSRAITRHQINVVRGRENIVPPKQMKKVIKNVFDDLSRMIKYTIGPAGGNTLVTEPYASTPIYPTKDGFTVMNNHIYENPTYESIYRVVRDISGRTNQELGDGTTSSVVWAADFYNRITKFLARHKEITPYGAKTLLDTIHEAVTTALKEHNYIVDIKSLPKEAKIDIFKRIATIAANNDSDVGSIVAEAYEKAHTEEPFIDVQTSFNEETTIDTDVGFEIPYGYNLAYMANGPDGITAEYDKPLILLVNGPLGDKSLQYLKLWIKWIAEDPANPRPFVIIAEEFGKEILDYLTICRTGISRTIGGQRVLVKLPVLSICFNMSSEYGNWRVEDLEAILGAKSLKTNNGNLIATPSNATEFMMMLGRADHIESRFAFTRIRGGAGDRAVRNGRIEEIKRLLNQNRDAAQHGVQAVARLEMLRKRISMLEGEMQIIKVGGDSHKEKRNRKLIFDDATCAVKACIEHGITLGGQVSVSDLIANFKEDLVIDVINLINKPGSVKNIGINLTPAKLEKLIAGILDIISESSKAPFKAVFENATNNKCWIKKTFKDFSGEFNNFSNTPRVKTYNLISNKFERLILRELHDVENGTRVIPEVNNLPDLIVPGNTDYECFKSVISIVGLFLTSNQLISLLVRDDK